MARIQVSVTDLALYQNLSKSDCLNRHSDPFFPHANLLAVVEDSTIPLMPLGLISYTCSAALEV